MKSVDILSIYVSLMPAIISGILNMVFCKLPVLKALQTPMDFGGTLADGKRIFGDNKTFKGFIGYLVINSIVSVIWGLTIINNEFLMAKNLFYVNYYNNIAHNVLVGLLLGLGYALFELPNSFIKRRLGITEGKSTLGMSKFIFVFIDQADSVIGCALVVWMFYSITGKQFIFIVLVGAITHIVINIMLYFMKLRKNMF